ncbi:deoxyhypusine synthase [Ignisphaera aggregans DSM 17230]|uniref:Deoxyhypusine synthase n=1 Tax=Ignisphaera aggregans (strain DSM 17230 / JCM 13409 / AQ1.S1) TaxID=583356 RepID=E0SSQ4_IGNAA|nr:deoxyhypusine synthase [Ignisphaera aggregans DSM 17230]
MDKEVVEESNPYLIEKLKTIEVRGRSISEILRDMADTAYQGRALGEVYKIIVEMLQEPNTTIFLGLAGSMSTAGMWKIIKWFIENRYVDVVVSTGANISEDIYEAMGFSYYKGSPYVDDSELLKYKIDRFYDVYASELNYRKMENLIKEFIYTLPKGSIYSTAEFLYLFGRYLNERNIDSIVAAAYRKKVPVFSPALVDSGYGIAAIMAIRERGHNIVLDMVKDFDQIVEIGRRSEKLSAIYIGGGVPKDYVNLVTVAQTIIAEKEGIKDYYKPLEYVVQITTDAPQWGGLSGATLEEAVSWGKVAPKAKKRVVYVDATIALPLIAHAILEEGIKRKNVPDLSWIFKDVT